MNSYVQETDSKMVFPYQKNQTFDGLNNETSGRENTFEYSLDPLENEVLRDPFEFLNQRQADEVTDLAKILIQNINELLVIFSQLGYETSNIPALRSYNVEDGSILLEWISDEFRIGFNIEPEVNNSSWYIVTSKDLGSIESSGYIQFDKNLNPLLLWILNFLFSNCN